MATLMETRPAYTPWTHRLVGGQSVTPPIARAESLPFLDWHSTRFTPRCRPIRDIIT